MQSHDVHVMHALLSHDVHVMHTLLSHDVHVMHTLLSHDVHVMHTLPSHDVHSNVTWHTTLCLRDLCQLFSVGEGFLSLGNTLLDRFHLWVPLGVTVSAVKQPVCVCDRCDWSMSPDMYIIWQVEGSILHTNHQKVWEVVPSSHPLKHLQNGTKRSTSYLKAKVTLEPTKINIEFNPWNHCK